MGRSMRPFEKACLWCIICADMSISILLRLLGPVLVVVANGLIGLVVYMYIWVLLPRYLIHQIGKTAAYSAVSFGLCILFNILFNYWSCVLTRPGFPGDHLPAIDDLEDGESPDMGYGRFCKKCKYAKPPRTHHCSVCRRCVMKMDHHCPWVNNCVGFYNYKYFCLFLLYLATGCLFTAVSCAIPLWSDSDMRRDQVIVFVFVSRLPSRTSSDTCPCPTKSRAATPLGTQAKPKRRCQHTSPTPHRC